MRTMANSARPREHSLEEGQEAPMGIVVTFPAARSVRDGVPHAGSATVIILPVVRIERYDDDPPGHAEPSSPGRKRRRRASRT
jgi:hypothetical protein